MPILNTCNTICTEFGWLLRKIFSVCLKTSIFEARLFDWEASQSKIKLLFFLSLCKDLSRCKKVMEERGELFLEKISMSRAKVAKLCHTFIKDGAVSIFF